MEIRAYATGVGRLLVAETRYRTVISGGPGQCRPGFWEVIEDGDSFSIPAGFGHYGCQCSIRISVEEIPAEEPNETENEITPISLGSSGEDVRALQARLNELGYTDDSGRRLVEDGSFGPRTEQAVNKFKDAVLPGGNQGENRGVVGATTWEYLEKAEPAASELQRKINEGNITSLLSRDYPEEPNVDKYLVFNNPWQTNIDPVFAMRLAALARDNNIIIVITSGLRSHERQIELYTEAGGKQVDGKWIGVDHREVSPPGQSWHEHGQAVDTHTSFIKGLPNGHETLVNYGLIKPISSELWHVQPVETRGISNVNERRSFYDAYMNSR